MRWNVKSQFSTKQGALATHFATGMSRKFQSPVTKLAKLYFLFCNDLVVLTLQLLAYFTCVLHFGKSPLASQLRFLVASHFAARMSREFQSPVAKLGQTVFFVL